MKSFDDFWNGFQTQPKTPLASKVRYIRDTKLENANIEMLEEFVLRWTENNTDPLTAEECALEEVVLYIECAKQVQEEKEVEQIKILNFKVEKERIKKYLE